MNQSPLVYAVILNWNSFNETIELINQLEKIQYDNLKILVVDNFSQKDDSRKLLKQYLKSTVELFLNDKNTGYAGGNNIGIKAALERNANFVWILNPDIRVEPDCLQHMIRTALSDSKIAAVGSRICYRMDKEFIFSDGGMVDLQQGLRTYHLHSRKRVHEVEQQEIYDVDYANGSSLLLRKEALEKQGYFKDKFFLYFEETEWCLRAKQDGWRIVNSGYARAYHSPSSKGAVYHYYMTRNRIWLSKIYAEKAYLRATILYEISNLASFTKQAGKFSIIRIRVICAKCKGLLAGIFFSAN